MAAKSNTVIKNRLNSILASLRGLTRQQVLVGIPEDHTGRSDAMTNAMIGYLMENGSPANNVPARPHLIPGVRKSEPQWMPHLRAAANFALDGEPQKVQHSLMRAGIIASSAVRKEITTGNFVPLSPVTVARRHEARGTASMRAGETRYMALVRLGMAPQSAQDATGIRPLINTGQLRNAYTYVIRRVK